MCYSKYFLMQLRGMRLFTESMSICMCIYIYILDCGKLLKGNYVHPEWSPGKPKDSGFRLVSQFQGLGIR